MPKVKIPRHVADAALVVKEWIEELQDEYDRNLSSGDLNSYYDAIQPIADEEELEFWLKDGEDEE